MAVIVKRYINALYNSTKDSTKRDNFEEDLRNLAELFNSNKEVKQVILDPRLDDKTKMGILSEIFSKSNSTFINFVKLLIKEKRINLINEMLAEYEKVNRELKKELFIKIIVASEIGESQIEKIVQKFKKIYKVNTIKYSIEIDEKILGGIKVIVGNKIYDSSIKTQLSQIF